MLINTATDLQTAEPSAERTAFLQNLLNDYIIFDDAEYPPASDYLDGIAKGDQQQIDAYVAACLAVKEKYSFPAALQAQLDEQHAPTKAQGLPWS